MVWTFSSVGLWTRVCVAVAVVVSVLPCVVGSVTYLKIKTPSRSVPWEMGKSNPITWISARDEIAQFDVQLARLRSDGLLFVARNVSTSWHALNVELNSVPTGDDYYVIFLDSTHGVVHALSERFSIVAAGGSAPSGSFQNAVPTASTVTLSGGPHPTAQFAFTFVTWNGASTRWGAPGYGWHAVGWNGMLAGVMALGVAIGSLVALL